jgi:hypothetical protein
MSKDTKSYSIAARQKSSALARNIGLADISDGLEKALHRQGLKELFLQRVPIPVPYKEVSERRSARSV